MQKAILGCMDPPSRSSFLLLPSIIAPGRIRAEWPEGGERWLFGAGAKSLLFRLVALYL
jgi:hypothetical protein